MRLEDLQFLPAGRVGLGGIRVARTNWGELTRPDPIRPVGAKTVLTRHDSIRELLKTSNLAASRTVTHENPGFLCKQT